MGYLDNVLKQIQQLNLNGVNAEGVKRSNGNTENINIGNMLRGNGIGGTDYANNKTNSIASEALEQFTAKTPETRINPDGSGTKVTTKTDNFTIFADTTSVDVVNKVDAVLEIKLK